VIELTLLRIRIAAAGIDAGRNLIGQLPVGEFMTVR